MGGGVDLNQRPFLSTRNCVGSPQPEGHPQRENHSHQHLCRFGPATYSTRACPEARFAGHFKKAQRKDVKPLNLEPEALDLPTSTFMHHTRIYIYIYIYIYVYIHIYIYNAHTL